MGRVKICLPDVVVERGRVTVSFVSSRGGGLFTVTALCDESVFEGSLGEKCDGGVAKLGLRCDSAISIK